MKTQLREGGGETSVVVGAGRLKVVKTGVGHGVVCGGDVRDGERHVVGPADGEYPVTVGMRGAVEEPVSVALETLRR